jgi:hypothetical protein
VIHPPICHRSPRSQSNYDERFINPLHIGSIVNVAVVVQNSIIKTAGVIFDDCSLRSAVKKRVAFDEDVASAPTSQQYCVVVGE